MKHDQSDQIKSKGTKQLMGVKFYSQYNNSVAKLKTTSMTVVVRLC